MVHKIIFPNMLPSYHWLIHILVPLKKKMYIQLFLNPNAKDINNS